MQASAEQTAAMSAMLAVGAMLTDKAQRQANEHSTGDDLRFISVAELIKRDLVRTASVHRK